MFVLSIFTKKETKAMPGSQIMTTGDLLLKHVRETMSLALLDAAQRRNTSIHSNNLVYLALNGATMAGVPMQGVEDLATGANVALLYLSLPASQIPEDYYLLRVKGTAREATAELIGSEGVSGGDTTVVIADAPPAPVEGFKITGASYDGVKNCVTISGTYTTASGATLSVSATFCGAP